MTRIHSSPLMLSTKECDFSQSDSVSQIIRETSVNSILTCINNSYYIYPTRAMWFIKLDPVLRVSNRAHYAGKMLIITTYSPRNSNAYTYSQMCGVVSTHVLSRFYENTDIVINYNNIMHDGAIHSEIINEVWNRFCMYAYEILTYKG